MKQANLFGFTLLEVIITLLVISILATMALPAYTTQLLKGRRSEGYSALNTIMLAQQRHIISNGSYTADLTQLGYTDPYPTPSGFYRVSADSCDQRSVDQCIKLVAHAQGEQKKDRNGLAGSISLDSFGRKQGW